MSAGARLRALARGVLPPLVVEALGRTGLTRNQWTGDYSTWAAAVAESTGYDEGVILQRVRDSALKVKRGEAVFERDSVLFDEVEYSWPVLAALMWVAARDGGRLDVLDFGGALGSSYFQNRRFVDSLPDKHWSVVEQPHFVAAGQKDFSDDRLSFFDTIEACAAARRPNVVLLSSVLQYLEQPEALLGRLSGFRFVVIDLTPASTSPRHRLTVQMVPPTIYPARYPCWIFSEHELRRTLERHFDIVVAFDPALGQDLRVGRDRARYRGYILERRP